MTEHSQQIVLAEARGWRFSNDCWFSPKAVAKGKALATNPDVWWAFTEESKLPDYLHDLNAIHEEEKTLNCEQYEIFADFLHNIVNGYAPSDYVQPSDMGSNTQILSATAAQRTEAVLRALERWDDTR